MFFYLKKSHSGKGAVKVSSFLLVGSLKVSECEKRAIKGMLSDAPYFPSPYTGWRLDENCTLI